MVDSFGLNSTCDLSFLDMVDLMFDSLRCNTLHTHRAVRSATADAIFPIQDSGFRPHKYYITARGRFERGGEGAREVKNVSRLKSDLSRLDVFQISIRFSNNLFN